MTFQADPILERLLEEHGTLFSVELGLDLRENTPSVLFRWLCTVLLMGTRIPHERAVAAARALSDAGWTTATSMADSLWIERVEVLNRAGFAGCDESTARILGQTARRLLDDYGGDLRRLREDAGRDADQQRERLRAFNGIDDFGADIFLREAQIVWDEHSPFLDGNARSAARSLGLSDDPRELAERVGQARLAPLAAALVRAERDSITPEYLNGTKEGTGT